MPCLKIYCNRLALFMKFYPVAEKDIIWFGEVIEGLNTLKKIKELKLTKAIGIKTTENNTNIETEKSTDKVTVNAAVLVEEYENILKRIGCGKWRFSEANFNYNLCPSYSRIQLIPESISDTVLLHASRFRVQNRFPLLANIYKGKALIRSGQPLVGLTQRRCVQDEKLIEAIKNNCGDGNGKLLIVDARPSTSAFANTLIGAGIERLECYEGSERIYLNLENIHTIRESHDRLCHQIKIISASNSESPRSLWIEVEEGSAWLDHLRGILEGTRKIVEAMSESNSHVLVHCSDGWDRTSQLISLCQLCLFPEYRTKKGFKLLILKDWLSAGHRFSDRNSHRTRIANNSRIASAAVTKNPWNSIKNFFQDDQQAEDSTPTEAEECPIFLQFIEATVQLCRQFPLDFGELTDEFLLGIVDDAYEGTRESKYFGNCEAERINYEDSKNDNIDSLPLLGITETDHVVVLPRAERSKMILWPAYYKRYF